jgi:hypothetical protein
MHCSLQKVRSKEEPVSSVDVNQETRVSTFLHILESKRAINFM